MYDALLYNIEEGEQLANAPYGISINTWDSIQELSSWIVSELFGSTKIGKLTGGALLNNLFGWIDKHNFDMENSPKMILYFAHYETLLALFAALKLSYGSILRDKY